MKVVFFSTATSYVGGAIISLIKILPLMQEQGVNPCIILKGHGPLESLLQEKGIPYYVVKSYDWCVAEKNTRSIKKSVKWVLQSVCNIIAEIKTFFILKKENADIYHLNCMFNGTGVKAAHFLKVPIVWHFREFLDLPGETPVFMNTKKTWKVLNGADKIICVSNYLADAYRNKVHTPSKIEIIYDGIELNKFQFQNSAKRLMCVDEVVIGLSGVAPIKNHIDAILALSILKGKTEKNIILKIAGNWSAASVGQLYMEKIRNVIVEHGLENDVQFVGMQDDMNSFWKDCHVSLICSKRESFGLSATEAMACGVSTICSSTSISGELTDNGKNVFVYETGNYEQLAELLEFIIDLKNNKLLDEKNNRAEKFVREKFSIDKTAKEICALYREVYNGSIG